MKLGPHIIQNTSAALDWARKAPVVKAIDRIDALQAAPDSAIRIFRQSYANEMDTSDPKGTVNKIVAGLKGYWHRNLYVQIWTGAHPTLVQLQTAVLLCHMNNLKTVGSSWFTGDYTQQDWMDALDASVDAFAPQCYWGNQGFTKDHALRYRQFWKPGQPPVMILECGRDAVEGGKGGWQKDGLSPQAYADELDDYATALAADSYVLGATPFTNGPTPDWASFDMDPIAPLLPKGGQPTMPQDFTSPNHGGLRKATNGIVLHATLGGTSSAQADFDATVNWFNSPASEVSAHALVGPNGQLWRPVHTDVVAWHAKAANVDHLGVEMAKPHLVDVIGSDILDTAAKLVAGWCHDYEIPLVWSASHGIEEHRNIPGNDHQDVGGPFDRDDFLARVKRYAGQEDELTQEQKTKLLDHLNVMWGESKATTIVQNPAESERAIHERIVAIKELLGVNG